MDVVLAVLPFLAFLACPLLMGLCMFGMGKKGGDAPAMQSPAASQLPEERVAALQAQLQEIQAELAALPPISPPALAPVASSDRPVDLVPGAVHAARRPA